MSSICVPKICSAAKGGQMQWFSNELKEITEPEKIVKAIVDGEGRSLIVNAIIGKKEKIINLLLDVYGVDPCGEGSNDDPPLHYLFFYECDGKEEKRERIARKLLEKGARIDCQNQFGETALYLAMEEGDEWVMRFCVRSNANVNGVLSNRRPLLSAVRNGFLCGVRYLVEHGADVNITDHQGRTPLVEAVHSDDVEAARFLLATGNINPERDDLLVNILTNKARNTTAKVVKDIARAQMIKQEGALSEIISRSG